MLAALKVIFRLIEFAVIAQLVERRHGKAEVLSSILSDGSNRKIPRKGIFCIKISFARGLILLDF